MKKEKILLNFSTYKQIQLYIQGNVVLQKCVTNCHKFHGLEPLIEKLKEATKGYMQELSKRTTKENKTARRKELITILTTIGRLVEEQSEGDIVKIYSAGFDVVKKKPVRPLGEAKNFRLKHLSEGEIELRCEPNKNAKCYLWEYMQVDGVQWIQQTTTAAKIILKGLEIGKEHRFRVMLIGKHELRTYSNEIKRFVV